jgi:hypothetical protein
VTEPQQQVQNIFQPVNEINIDTSRQPVDTNRIIIQHREPAFRFSDSDTDTTGSPELPLVRGHVELQELVVRALLDVDQVRDVDDFLELREALADPEIVLDYRRHGVISLLGLEPKNTQ